MRRLGLAGVIVAIAAALGAPAGAGAVPVPPEFGRCVKQAGGRFATASCTTEVAGKTSYEYLPGPGPKPGFHIASTAGSLIVMETVGGTKLVCHSAEGAGEVRNHREVGNLLLTFKGCETSGGKVNSPGHAEGEVVTSALEGSIGIEKVGTKTPFNDVVAEEWHAAAGQDFIQAECAGLSLVVTGSVLHQIPANHMSALGKEKLVQAKGRQKPESFAGGVPGEHVLGLSVNGAAPVQMGLAFPFTTTYEEPIEVNTVA